MKNGLFFLFCSLFTCFLVRAQTNTFPASGNAGIGISNPQTGLHLWDNVSNAMAGGNSKSVIRLSNDYASAFNSGGELQFGLSNAAGADVLSAIKGTYSTWNSGNLGGSLAFYTRHSDGLGLKSRMYIKSDGNIGIGTTNPNSPLTIGYNSGNNQFALQRSDGAEAFSMYLNASNRVAFINGSGGGDYDFQSNVGGQGIVSTLFIEGLNGNVGLGTTNPTEKLEINGGHALISNTSTNLTIEGTGTGNYNGATLILKAAGTNSGDKHGATTFNTHRGTDGTAVLEMQRRDLANNYNGTLLMYKDGYGWDFRTGSSTTSTGTGIKLRIKNTGEVGIGTTDPQEKLHVSGNILGNKLMLNDPNDTSDWNTLWQSGFYQSYNAANAPEASAWFWGLNMNHGTNNVNYKYNGQIAIKNSSVDPVMYFRSTNVDGIGTWTKVIHSEGNQTINGNLGIGTADTKGFKLGVQGKIAAEEVKVATYTNWSDFVFDKDYNLPTLKEVEQHIKEKGHLKDIPNAEEVKKEGFYLAEMNAKLLQKIEELTLYTIAQEKRIELIENKNEKLEEENQVLKSLFDRVKKLEENIKQ